MTNYTKSNYEGFANELMALHVFTLVFLDRYENVIGPILYDSLADASENIHLDLKNSEEK